MEQPPSKRSKRLNQIIAKKQIENENIKRKIPSAQKTINAQLADAVNVKLKFEKDGKKIAKDVQPKKGGKIKPKKKTGENVVKETNEKQDENSSVHDVETAGKVEATDGKGDESLSYEDEVSSNEDSLDVANTRDVEPKRAARNIEPKKAPADGKKSKLKKPTRNQNKDEKNKKTTVDQPKVPAVKIKPKKEIGGNAVKETNEKQDENSSDHDVETAGKVEATDGKGDESLSSEDEVSSNEDSSDVANARDVEPKRAPRNIEPKKARADGKKSKLKKPTRNQNKDEKNKKTTVDQPKVPAVKIKPKKEIGGNAVNETNEKQDENSSDHDVETAGKVEATDGKDDESLNSGDSLDVANPRDVEPKIAARNVNPKKADGKDEVKPNDEHEMELDTDDDSDLSDAPQNNGRILKVMSRIENKLDSWVSQGVNEKRMFAIVLKMPFDLVEDINQYNSDLLDVDIYLKFVKYFECVGGNNDGKIVCNILHQIATPDLLSNFDWQISSSKSFQGLKNIVKLIHTAAKGKCSERFDMTVCGEVIKNVLRNARGGVYKK